MNLDKWHLLCHATEVNKKQSFVSAKIFDQEIICHNDENELLLFKNFCPHRGSKLTNESCGLWEGRCPYHGLQFKQLQAINADKLGFNDNGSKRLHLHKVNKEECGKFIFFNLTQDPGTSLKEQLGEVLYDHLSKISDQIDVLIDLNEYQYQCRWEVAIENALEPLHLPTIHANSLDLLNLDDGKIVTDNGGLYFDHNIQNKRYKKSLGILKPRLRDPGFPSTYHSTYIYPFGFISSTYGLSFSVQTFFPSTEKFNTNFSSKLFTAKLAKEEDSQLFASFFDSTIKTNRQVFEEDFEATKNIVKMNDYFLGPIAKSEEKIKWFRKKIREN